MERDYSIEYAIEIARARVASVPELANAALIDALWIQRTQILAPEATAALARIIQNLTTCATAQDALNVEREAAQCHSQ